MDQLQELFKENFRLRMDFEIHKRHGRLEINYEVIEKMKAKLLAANKNLSHESKAELQEESFEWY